MLATADATVAKKDSTSGCFSGCEGVNNSGVRSWSCTRC